jgi:hypothetical protein
LGDWRSCWPLPLKCLSVLWHARKFSLQPGKHPENQIIQADLETVSGPEYWREVQYRCHCEPRLTLRHGTPPAEWQNSNSLYELVTICFWSVVVVSLTTVVIWLALGDEL